MAGVKRGRRVRSPRRWLPRNDPQATFVEVGGLQRHPGRDHGMWLGVGLEPAGPGLVVVVAVLVSRCGSPPAAGSDYRDSAQGHLRPNDHLQHLGDGRVSVEKVVQRLVRRSAAAKPRCCGCCRTDHSLVDCGVATPERLLLVSVAISPVEWRALANARPPAR